MVAAAPLVEPLPAVHGRLAAAHASARPAGREIAPPILLRPRAARARVRRIAATPATVPFAPMTCPR